MIEFNHDSNKSDNRFITRFQPQKYNLIEGPERLQRTQQKDQIL